MLKAKGSRWLNLWLSDSRFPVPRQARHGRPVGPGPKPTESRSSGVENERGQWVILDKPIVPIYQVAIFSGCSAREGLGPIAGSSSEDATRVMDIRTVCLGALLLGDSTGYDLKKLFEEGPFSHFFDASFGSIYPALSRLCEEGLIAERQSKGRGHPGRKVYAISDAGRRALIETISATPMPDRYRSEFLFCLTLADLVPVEKIRRLIDLHIERLEAQIAEIDRNELEVSSPAWRLASGYGRAMASAGLRYLKENRAMLDSIGSRTAQTDRPDAAKAARPIKASAAD